MLYGQRTTQGAFTLISTAFDHALQLDSSDELHACTLNSITRFVPAGAVEVKTCELVPAGSVYVSSGFPGDPLLIV